MFILKFTIERKVVDHNCPELKKSYLNITKMINILHIYQVRNTSRNLVEEKADTEWIQKVINSRRYKYLMNNYRNEDCSKYSLLYKYLCSLTLFSLSSISAILYKRYIYILGLTSKKHT